jgi:hypothetical protein
MPIPTNHFVICTSQLFCVAHPACSPVFCGAYSGTPIGTCVYKAVDFTTATVYITRFCRLWRHLDRTSRRSRLCSPERTAESLRTSFAGSRSFVLVVLMMRSRAAAAIHLPTEKSCYACSTMLTARCPRAPRHAFRLMVVPVSVPMTYTSIRHDCKSCGFSGDCI